MSVIARKIAYANKPDADRPDADRLAESLLPILNRCLCRWLAVEEAQIELKAASWLDTDSPPLGGVIIASRGSRRSRRIALSISEPLAEMAAIDVLQLETKPNPDALAVLRSFVEQNVLSLGPHVNKTRLMVHSGREDPDWGLSSPETVQTDFEAYDVLALTIDYLDGDGGDMTLTLRITSEMLALNLSEGAHVASDQKAPRLPPRLGPYHVEVQAVADQVRMSVADCTRLKIGQIVALPRLQFDKLDLTVGMDVGPVKLTEASLGADKGQKAVRLNRGLDPEFRLPSPETSPSSKTGAVPA